jgi:hypothetical protein
MTKPARLLPGAITSNPLGRSTFPPWISQIRVCSEFGWECYSETPVAAPIAGSAWVSLWPLRVPRLFDCPPWLSAMCALTRGFAVAYFTHGAASRNQPACNRPTQIPGYGSSLAICMDLGPNAICNLPHTRRLRSSKPVRFLTKILVYIAPSLTIVSATGIPRLNLIRTKPWETKGRQV